LGAGVTRQRERASSRGGEQTGKDPTNRGKLGTKRHVVVDRQGVPLAETISGANVHDSKLLEETVDAIPALRLPHRQRGRPRKRPTKLHARGADGRCGRAVSPRALPDVASNRVSDSAASAGWWSAHCPGSTVSGA